MWGFRITVLVVGSVLILTTFCMGQSKKPKTTTAKAKQKVVLDCYSEWSRSGKVTDNWATQNCCEKHGGECKAYTEGHYKSAYCHIDNDHRQDFANCCKSTDNKMKQQDSSVLVYPARKCHF